MQTMIMTAFMNDGMFQKVMTAGQDGVPAVRGRGKPVNIKTEKENEHENL